MKKQLIPFAQAILVCSTLALASCATIFTRSKVVLESGNVDRPIDVTVDGRAYKDVVLPCKVKVRRNFKPTTVTASAKGYKTSSLTIEKKFNPISIINVTNLLAWAVDCGTGAIAKPVQKHYSIFLDPEDAPAPVSVQDTTIPQSEARKVVGRDNAGGTDLEQTIIRWYFDSDPQGAQVYWRVISSIPAEVKNTNELYLGTTPYEETRSFSILGLTYENARDVQIEVKIKKKGYYDSVKRFNVRQAIDQQEISSFYELIERN